MLLLTRRVGETVMIGNDMTTAGDADDGRAFLSFGRGRERPDSAVHERAEACTYWETLQGESE
jgi:hypothetical protein